MCFTWFRRLTLLPDVIPGIGWLDDILLTGTGILNLIQSYVREHSIFMAKVIGFVKWGLILLGVIAIGILILAGVAVYHAVS